MKIVIEYIGIDREDAAELLRHISAAAAETAINHPEIGYPDNVSIER